MSCRRDDVVAPDPEQQPERDDWLATCPHYLAVVLGETKMAALEAWEDHELAEPPPLPEKPLSGRTLLEALLTPGTDENWWARWAVRDYWKGWSLLPKKQVGFTGAHFDSLGYVDDKDPNPDRFTATDIVAVSMLGVDVPAGTSLGLLGPDDGNGTNKVLGEIHDKPPGVVSGRSFGPVAFDHA